MTTASLLDERLARDLRPPKKPRSITDFAKTLRLPDGPSAGNNWIPETEPTQAAFLRHVESGKWRKFVLVAPSQRGKTLKGVLCPALYAITECRQSVGYVMPNLDKLTQNWEGKIKPAIEGTGYGEWLPKKGPGSKGGKPAVLTLRDPSSGQRAGQIYFMATGTGGRETSVSSVSPQTLVYDEADDAASVGQIELVFRRVESYGLSGRCYVVSTVNDRAGREGADPNEPASSHPILLIHNQGSQHRQHHRCPHCSGYFAPDYEHLDLERNAIVCALCGVLWSEEDRRDALNRSLSAGRNDTIAGDEVIPGEYDTDIYSETTGGLDYHMAVIPTICAQVRAAKMAEARGDFSLMRTLMHKVFCRPYEEPAGIGEITNAGLAVVSSRSDYDKRIVPHWVTHLVGTVDIQGDRHYWQVNGFGPDDRSCLIDWGYDFLVPLLPNGKRDEGRQPTPADRRRSLHDIDVRFNEGWSWDSHEEKISPIPGLRGVDVGYLTDEIVNWLRGMRGWRAIKGCGKDNIKNLGKHLDLPAEAKSFVEARQPDGWPIPLLHVLADNVRRWIHAALLRDPYAPGSYMLPRGLKANDDICLHLSGEVEIVNAEGKVQLVEKRVRHDYLDCSIYGHALFRLRTGVQSMKEIRKTANRRYGYIGSIV